MRLCIILLVLSYFLCGGPSTVIAQQQKDRAVGTATIAVTEVDGTVEILPKAEVERQRGIRVLSDLWKPALPRTMLSSGDQLRTGAGSSMKLELNDGTTVTLSSDSVLVVEDLRSARGQTPQTTQLLLEKGKISTQQTAKILGQTNQIIRTENGSVNTRLGEVEVWKPELETKKYVLLAALSSQLPRVVQKVEKSDKTYVTLNRGTTVIDSSGKGRMIANSILLPETCVGQDGIKFTLDKPKTQVTVSKLEDQNGFRLSSNEDFHLLVGTEGMSNKINVVTKNSDAEVDLEGVHVADYDSNSGAIFLMHPMLTVGVRSSDLLVNLICDDAESKGLNEFDVRGISGDVNVLRTSFGGRDTSRPNPSLGRSDTRRPTPPIPTPGEEAPTPTPTPTSTPEEESPPRPGGPVPVTDLRPAAPTIASISGPTVSVSDPSCGGIPLQNRVDLRIEYNDLTPFVVGGNFYRQHPAVPPPTIASFTMTIDAPPYLVQSNYQYSYSGGESAYLDYWFCYDPLGALAGSDFEIWITDANGNPSNVLYYSPLP